MKKIILMMVISFNSMAGSGYTSAEFETVARFTVLLDGSYALARGCIRSYESNYRPNGDCKKFSYMKVRANNAMIKAQKLGAEKLTLIIEAEPSYYRSLNYISPFKILVEKIDFYNKISQCQKVGE